MTRLSVNINKIALLRNARGTGIPNLVRFAEDCERFGAEGITVHPRQDERHIKVQDVYDLKPVVKTELNVEGYPSERFINTVLAVKPHQCTLVPDTDNQLTSDHGWDTAKHRQFLTEVLAAFSAEGIRTALFIDPVPQMIEGAAKVGADCIELYTGPYAWAYEKGDRSSAEEYREAGRVATNIGLGINAGHDLNLDNLTYFLERVEGVKEVSIGHALIRDCLYFGLENTIQMYLRKCR